MIPTGWPTASYSLSRPTSRAYEGFIVAVNTPAKVFATPSRLNVIISPPQVLQVRLVYGTYSELLTFGAADRAKQTTQLFPGLTSFTTTILSTQGGMAVNCTDPQGRPVHFNDVLETGQCYIARRAHPVAFSVLGQIVQSEATALKEGGVEPRTQDLLSSSNNTYTVIRVNQARTMGLHEYYQIDLQRTGRE